jgi:hypothetical protein
VALKKVEHESLLKAAGFETVSIEVTQVHSPEAITEWRGKCCPVLREAPAASAFVRAQKPVEWEERGIRCGKNSRS